MNLTLHEFEEQENLTIRDQFISTNAREAFGKKSYISGLGLYNDI